MMMMMGTTTMMMMINTFYKYQHEKGPSNKREVNLGYLKIEIRLG